MLIYELTKTKPRKHVAFAFGRMNPPTVGHAQLINTVAESANGGDWVVFLSQTQDTKKNPLPWTTKLSFLKQLFPKQAGHFYAQQDVRTIMDALEKLYQMGYTDITYVAGSDRLPAFKSLIEKYNGVDGGKTYYKFNSVNYTSSGDRDPDDENSVAGVSASAAREAAVKGDYEEFRKIVGANELSKLMYSKVRTHMNLDAEVAEDASGYIPKNKREAKDPRWSMALSVDVTPETPTKNAKALRLA